MNETTDNVQIKSIWQYQLTKRASGGKLTANLMENILLAGFWCYLLSGDKSGNLSLQGSYNGRC